VSPRIAAEPPDEWTEELDGDGEVDLESEVNEVAGLADAMAVCS